MKLDTFRRLDQHDRRIRQLERTETGGSGGATSLDDLTDVAAASMDDDDVLTFQASDNTWYPKAPTGLPGPAGPPGADGADSTVPGPPGEGVPAGGTVGQVLTKDTGTDFDTSWQTGAAHADTDHDDRFALLAHTHAPVEIDYAQITGNVNTTATTSATSTLVVSGAAVTYTAVAHEFEFFAPHVSAPQVAGGSTHVGLFDGAAGSPVGRFAQVRTPSATAATGVPVFAKMRVTPSAGSHTYQVRIYLSTAGTGVVHAGAGAGDVHVPAYLKVTRLT